MSRDNQNGDPEPYPPGKPMPGCRTVLSRFTLTALLAALALRVRRKRT